MLTAAASGVRRAFATLAAPVRRAAQAATRLVRATAGLARTAVLTLAGPLLGAVHVAARHVRTLTAPARAAVRRARFALRSARTSVHDTARQLRAALRRRNR